LPYVHVHGGGRATEIDARGAVSEAYHTLGAALATRAVLHSSATNIGAAMVCGRFSSKSSVAYPDEHVEREKEEM